MCVSYAAYDPKLDRKIALKLLHASEQPGTAHFRHSQAQLEREARAAAKLSHPNVVQVYDVGVVDEQVYMALEYIDGSTLTDWLEEPERARSWREVVEMFLETAKGLIAAHDAGVVHRDFKPDNVLLGADGRPRVADFGLARTTQGEGGGVGALAMISGPQYGPSETAEGMGAAHTVSAAGTIAGTPAYMSPEQFAGVTVGPASDQFSFCVALYEALFSARPFVGETLVALSGAVIAGELQDPPRGHGVPAGVVRAVTRGLESSADDRFPTMRALTDALRREVAPRRRWAWGLAGAVTATAMGGGAVFGMQLAGAPVDPCAAADTALDGVWNGEREAAITGAFAATGKVFAGDLARDVTAVLDEYARAWTSMRRDACEDTRVRGEQSEQLLDQRVACLDRRALRMQTLVAGLSEDVGEDILMAAPTAARELASLAPCEDRQWLLDPKRGGRFLARDLPPAERERFDEALESIERGRALDSLGRFDDARREASRARELGDALAQPWLQAQALNLAGDVSAGERDAEAALALLDESLWSGVAAGDGELSARVLISMAHLKGSFQGQLDEALTMLARAEPVAREQPEREELEVRARALKAQLLARKGERERSLALFDAVRPTAARVYGETHPLTLNVIEDHAIAYAGMGEWERAAQLFQELLTRRVELLGERHPEVATAWTNLGVASSELGDFARAMECNQNALEIYRAALGEHNDRVALALHNLADAAKAAGKLDEARGWHEEALEIRRAVLEQGHPAIGFSLDELGRVALAQGRLDDARELLTQARAQLEGALGADHPRAALAAHFLGETLLAQGDRVAAQAQLERALKALSEKDVDPLWRADTERVLAAALVDADPSRARALAVAAQARYRDAGERAADHLETINTWLKEHPAEG